MATRLAPTIIPGSQPEGIGRAAVTYLGSNNPCPGQRFIAAAEFCSPAQPGRQALASNRLLLSATMHSKVLPCSSNILHRYFVTNKHGCCLGGKIRHAEDGLSPICTITSPGCKPLVLPNCPFARLR